MLDRDDVQNQLKERALEPNQAADRVEGADNFQKPVDIARHTSRRFQYGSQFIGRKVEAFLSPELDHICGHQRRIQLNPLRDAWGWLQELSKTRRMTHVKKMPKKSNLNYCLVRADLIALRRKFKGFWFGGRIYPIG